METEKKLKLLFDFERFEKNKRLERLINETENRYKNELSDDDIEIVSAAGGIEDLIEKTLNNNNPNH